MIEVAILKNFDSGTYKAGVQLAGSLTTYFDDISVAKNIPSAAMVVGNYVILAIPGGNPKDACVIAAWPQGTPGGAEVHGNEYHDPDFEEEGVASSLVETHRTTETHTQSQPPAEHGNEKHDPDFEQEGVAATLIETHRTTAEHTQPQPSNFLKLSDTPSSYSGQAAKALRVKAAENGLEFYHPLWTPAIYTIQIPWTSLDGMITSIPAGGSVVSGVTAILLQSGATLNNNCLARSTYGFNKAWPSGKECTVEFPLSYRSGTNNHRIIFLMTDSTSLPPDETEDHVGFIIDAGNLYSSSADGTAQETKDTGINIGTGGMFYQCRVVIDPGVSVKFYVNNVLKTTHTTRPPGADKPGGRVLVFGVKTTANQNQNAAWERVIVSKEL